MIIINNQKIKTYRRVCYYQNKENKENKENKIELFLRYH